MYIHFRLSLSLSLSLNFSHINTMASNINNDFIIDFEDMCLTEDADLVTCIVCCTSRVKGKHMNFTHYKCSACDLLFCHECLPARPVGTRACDLCRQPRIVFCSIFCRLADHDVCGAYSYKTHICPVCVKALHSSADD